MKKRSFPALKDIVLNFNKSKVLVIGDLILDEYVWGDVSRISPEAPVPVVTVRKENFMLGGASNVAHNIASLGGSAFLAGVIGRDMLGKTFRAALRRQGLNTAGVVTDAARPTTLKTRIIAQHQQVARIDKERIGPVSAAVSSRLIKYVRENMDKVGALIIEDYGKGVVAPRLLSEIVSLARRKNKVIVVDPKEENFSFYRGITAITPNQHEASRAVGFEIKDEAALKRAGFQLLKKLRCNVVLTTLGERGMLLFQKGKKPVHIPTVAQDVFDVSGAGDTVVAAFTLALGCGAKPIDAAHIANYAAGIVVGKLGTAAVKRNELLKRINAASGNPGRN